MQYLCADSNRKERVCVCMRGYVCVCVKEVLVFKKDCWKVEGGNGQSVSIG